MLTLPAFRKNNGAVQLKTKLSKQIWIGSIKNSRLQDCREIGLHRSLDFMASKRNETKAEAL
jgi:hypothetical protein